MLTYGNSGVALANHGLKSMKGYQQMSYEQIAHMTGTKGEPLNQKLWKVRFPLLKNKTIRKLKSFNIVEGMGMAIASVAYEITKFGTDIVVGKVKGF